MIYIYIYIYVVGNVQLKLLFQGPLAELDI